MTPARSAAAVCAVLLAWTPAGSAAGTAASLLLPLSAEQVSAAGAAGTGCSWLPDDGQRALFAAADDRAVVRLRTRVVVLRPAAGAKDLFPFTFDRWTGDGVSVAVRPSGRARRKGAEASIRRAVLTVVANGTAVELRGRLDCGS